MNAGGGRGGIYCSYVIGRDISKLQVDKLGTAKLDSAESQ